MRFKTVRMRTIKFSNKITTKDSEGVPTVTYGAPARFRCEIWPASSELQIKTYGERVNAMYNVKVRGGYEINANQSVTFKNGFTLREGDGVYVYDSEKPDYDVVSIKLYKPLRLEIEKL